MERVDGLLRHARRLLLAGRALSWAARGLAVAGLAALAVELLVRVYPIDPIQPILLGCLAVGLLVAAGGWVQAWPSRAEVARLADLRLGGRERLSTAVEFATAEGTLIGRQREDAAAWATAADVAAVRDPGRPWRAAALALVAGLAVVALNAVPNPALQALAVERANQAAQDRAAAQIGQLVQQADRAQGETPAQKAALVQQLKNAQQAARSAPDPQSAVAALSQAQSQIRSLQDPSVGTQKQAASAAGQALQANPSSAKAGQALSAGDGQAAASELNQLASSVSQLTPAERQALANSLAAAAAQSASGNPKLSQSLQQAADALRQGDTAAAQQALQQAAQAEQQQAAAEQFNGDASQAINGLQQAKQQLAQQAPGQGQPSGPGQPAGSGQQPGQAPGGQAGPGQQGSPGAGAGQGQGQGTGTGSGNGNGTPGSGSGSGQGAGSGSGKTTASTEKVYVPGQSTGSGTPQGNAGDPGSGSNADLVPYTDYLARYRAAAQSEVDRQVIPQDEQDLVRQYFQDLGQ